MPQPIDMQTELGRALLADRIQQTVDRAALAASMRARLEGEDDQVLSETQVDESPESQSEHVDPELKRRNPYVRRRHNRESEGNDEQRDRRIVRPTGSDGHNFDVSV